MRWLFIIIGILLAFFLALLAAGSMLPVKHTVTRTITLNQPPEAVWQAITDHANDPKWRGDLASVNRIADRNGHPVWEENYKNGQTMRIETILSDPPKRLERKIVDQSAFGGVWVYEVVPSAGGKSTALKIIENGEVYNPLFRFLSRFVFGHSATIETYLKNLEGKFGEESVRM